MLELRRRGWVFFKKDQGNESTWSKNTGSTYPLGRGRGFSFVQIITRQEGRASVCEQESTLRDSEKLRKEWVRSKGNTHKRRTHLPFLGRKTVKFFCSSLPEFQHPIPSALFPSIQIGHLLETRTSASPSTPTCPE